MKYSVVKPMARPAHNPMATQKNTCLPLPTPAISYLNLIHQWQKMHVRGDSAARAYQFLTCFCSPKSNMVNLAGSAAKVTTRAATVISAVEMMS